MGHIQYYLQYKNLSHFYRNGANPGGVNFKGKLLRGLLSGFCPLNKSAWSLVPKKSQSYNNHTSQWIKWRLKDVNLRFPWGSRKRFKHCHGSWILRTAGSAQPRGGGHPWRGDQHQPSVCAGAEENCIPPIWIPYRQIPMGPLCWQSLQGEGPIAALSGYLTLLIRITWTATGGSWGVRSRVLFPPARGTTCSLTLGPRVM